MAVDEKGAGLTTISAFTIRYGKYGTRPVGDGTEPITRDYIECDGEFNPDMTPPSADSPDYERPMEVVLVRASDGERRIAQLPDWKPSYTWSDVYWWTEGNMGCDCNRALEWARAANEPEPDPCAVPCSTGKFFVILRDPLKVTDVK